jgi:hypothetical protein
MSDSDLGANANFAMNPARCLAILRIKLHMANALHATLRFTFVHVHGASPSTNWVAALQLEAPLSA